MFCLSGWIPPEKQEESIKAEESALLREKQTKEQKTSFNWINQLLNIIISWTYVKTLHYTIQMILRFSKLNILL